MRFVYWLAVRILLTLVAVPLTSLAFQVAQPLPTSTQETAGQRASQQDLHEMESFVRAWLQSEASWAECSEQDRQKMMDLLRIASLHPPVETPLEGLFPNLSSPGRELKLVSANYDEAKANPYPKLPDPLVLKNGKKVTSAKVWWDHRRPEIVEDFDREVYGRIPKTLPTVKWEVKSVTDEKVDDAAVVTKQLVGHVDNSSYPLVTVDLQLVLTVPAGASRPVPIIMEFGFVPPPGFVLPKAMTGLEINWQRLALAKNWGYAILVPTVFQADNGCGLTKGIIGLVNKGQPRKPDDWGVLRAWAWGASRALDYLETDRSVDAKKVAIEGVSRYGKAALVTMAYDQRFAMAFLASSGEGGAKLHRRNFGEPVENVTHTNEYHWMAGNFLKYAGPLNWNDLPVDSHELVALCAPRPVFLSVGNSIDPAVDFANSDAWADAKGTFLAAVGAGPVYKLLGKKDLRTTEFPPIDTGLIDGDLAFRQHSGGHTATPNWPVFLTFAERYFKAPSR